MRALLVVILLMLLMVLPLITLAQNPLDQRISLNLQNVPLDRALDEMSREGGFFFSYNADILPLDSIVTIGESRKPVGKILQQTITRPNIRYKGYGSHIIIYATSPVAAPRQKQEYVISGFVRNALTSEIIPYASIYRLDGSTVAVSDDAGHYSLSVSTDVQHIDLSFSKVNYNDTVIIVRPASQQQVNIALTPEITTSPLQKEEAELYPAERVEDVRLVRIFVPDEQQIHSQNIRIWGNRIFQLSFLPFLGTDGNKSGMLIHNFSLNMLAGYNAGINGVEVGGLMNIVRRDVNGVQIGGLGNATGGKMKGLQIAGMFNTNLRSVYGGQIAGFNNYAQDTVYGFQIAGFNNMLVGTMRGTQISGFNNLATREFDGVQIAGFSNLAIRGVSRFQASGFFNYTQRLTGMQAAGFANVSTKKAQGFQVAGFANVATGSIDGVQVGFINFADKVRGAQIGFLNIADSVKGVSIGFLSFILRGYNTIQFQTDENLFVRASAKTGVNRFYNILTAGYGLGDQKLWSFGYGIGFYQPIGKRHGLNLDFTLSNVEQQNRFDSALNFLGEVELQYSFKFGKALAIHAGPAARLLMLSPQATFEDDFSRLPLDVVYSFSALDHHFSGWFGFSAGLRVL